MKNFGFSLLVFAASLSPLRAQDCSSYWFSTLDTDPTHPKGFSGDTNVGYGLFSVRGDNTTKFVVKGNFPKARFMSLQTYNTRPQSSVDSIIDTQIEPDAGSLNPFRPNVPLDTPNRSFTLELVPEAYYSGAPNQVKLAAGILNHSFFYRIYAPNEGVTLTESDLPQVLAFDAATNVPIACPKHVELPQYLKFPQFLATVVSKFLSFDFRQQSSVAGANAGIPSYMYAILKMDRDQVVTVRFKAPTFLNTRPGVGFFPEGAETRYWSICLQNFPNNQTLACVPDFLATPDAKGFVTLVVGTGEEVKAAALAKGYNFLADSRRKNQKVLGFAYRNVLPEASFKTEEMYQGEYLPKGILCDKSDFLAGNCGAF